MCMELAFLVVMGGYEITRPARNKNSENSQHGHLGEHIKSNQGLTSKDVTDGKQRKFTTKALILTSKGLKRPLHVDRKSGGPQREDYLQHWIENGIVTKEHFSPRTV